MIQAIIFDCFGVLASDGWLPFKRKYFAHDPALLKQAGDLNKQVDSGFADYDHFIAEVARLSGLTEAETRKEIENNPVDEGLFAYIETELKPKYKIGMLSNAGANWLPQLFTPQQIALFDVISLSYETGVIKPDPQAYQVIAERLGVALQDCVFIDDQERFVTAAREVGMEAVTYDDLDELKSDLNKLL